MPIIVGCGRSGTTLLRLMLDAHPALAIPPETGFLDRAPTLSNVSTGLREALFDAVTQHPPKAPAWADFGVDATTFREALDAVEPFSIAAGYRTFYRLYADRHGKPRYGDKTPMYCLHLRMIADVLPEARFIHVIRDGRDVALSLRQTWFSPGPDVETQARHWQHWVTTGSEQGKLCPHYLELRYEDLIFDPRTNLRRVCDFIELDFDERMLAYHHHASQRLSEHHARYDSAGQLLVSHERRLFNQRKTSEPPDASRVYAWRTAMSADEAQRFAIIAGPVLRQFGYHCPSIAN
ncbi:sulfotransferase [Pseudolysobacter antarcticus]|uniref:Sulfotransferase n=1 Tax=Pseudolysobacter antarcticus TaxID=2511995 RepID=A0A411HI88_9GAMM|nr:sulfotransferase [Pseudolysobacter antarcticus]QBB70239.1 sulfotransferase [Pseudolysobacter antarcticus]